MNQNFRNAAIKDWRWSKNGAGTQIQQKTSAINVSTSIRTPNLIQKLFCSHLFIFIQDHATNLTFVA